MYARVIVDVVAKQINKPFDYLIPAALDGIIEVGSRVSVPFGPRLIQGFVIELFHISDMDAHKMKPIESVLDLIPPLTPELIKLAGWISHKYVCHEMLALQAMLPGALKVKYERYISLINNDETAVSKHTDAVQPLLHFISLRNQVSLQSIIEKFPNDIRLIKQLISKGILLEIQVIKDRLSAKKVLTVYPPEDIEPLRHVIELLSAKSKRQADVLRFLCGHPNPIRLTELTSLLDVAPASVKALADKGIIKILEVETFRDPYENRIFKKTVPLTLTLEQNDVFSRIRKSIYNKTHQTFLLHGVTGSGKTEVYLQSIQECLALGREAIVLVPEISLTPQMVERFKGRFGNLVAVLHSRLSNGERYDEWRKIQLGQVKVAIGARSAIFAPFQNLGLIVVDEEHESSYKQEESPKYHARDAAVWRGVFHQAVVLLGSATPSLETFSKAQEVDGDGGAQSPPLVQLLSMNSRVEGRPLPEVLIVDMREELRDGNRSMFSKALHQAIEQRLLKQEQMVLLLNRRGFSTFVMCRSCGYTIGCPHCDISLTFHDYSKMMRCHYCGYSERQAVKCPSCASEHIRYFGTGTQKVETELSKLFPGIRVIRMDVDTTSEKGSHEKWLTMFGNREADVLLGTQMVAKGLDFPHVTLVGVIAADTILHLPDFRSGEKTFQLLTQVAGRAGRHQLPGEVVIQSYNPEHYSIQCAGKHDYLSFAATELDLRRQRNYPPYNELILITISHERIHLVIRTGESIVQRIKEGLDDSRVDVLGPVACPIPRIKDKFRFQCIVKYAGNDEVLPVVIKAISQWDDTVAQEKLLISIDVDPQILM